MSSIFGHIRKSSSMWHTLQCPCNPDFTYASLTTFANHFDSNQHRYFEARKDLENSRVCSQMEIDRLKRQIQMLRTERKEHEKLIKLLRTQYIETNRRLSESHSERHRLVEALESMKMERL